MFDVVVVAVDAWGETIQVQWRSLGRRTQKGSRGSDPRPLGLTMGGYLITHSGSDPVDQSSSATRVRPSPKLACLLANAECCRLQKFDRKAGGYRLYHRDIWPCQAAVNDFERLAAPVLPWGRDEPCTHAGLVLTSSRDSLAVALGTDDARFAQKLGRARIPPRVQSRLDSVLAPSRDTLTALRQLAKDGPLWERI
jgi:hypothetical protein